MSEQKKKIEVINSNDSKIINPSFQVSNLEDELDAPSQDNGDFFPYDEVSEEPCVDEGLIPANVIEDAMKQAEEIIEGAKEAATTIEVDANAKGYDEGFKVGKKQALKEEQKLKLKLKEELERAVQERKKIITDLQPKVAEVIHRLVQNMVGIQKFDQDVILHLIKLGLEEVELSGDLIIRVSTDDYDEVNHNKEKLIENLSDKLSFEVLQDSKLNKNDCIIETSLGRVNCSLKERMDGLLRQLQLIEKSYSSYQ